MEQSTICSPIKERILWYVLWIVILTSVINGPSISKLLSWLKILTFEPAKSKIIHEIIQDIHDNF
jgi:hypothetical protein